MEVGDWHKNVEAMSAMGGKKKMFDAAGGSQQKLFLGFFAV